MADVFADIPEGYTRNRIDPQLRSHLNGVSEEISKLQDGRMTSLIEGTPYLEITTMRNREKDLLLVHLVNYDVLLDGTVTPAENVKIEILIPEGKKVKSISYGGELADMTAIAFEEKGRTIQCQVPKVNIYGMVLVTF
jgi:hypothetical protein